MSKQLFGALVGALVGVGGMIAVEMTQGREFAWTVLLVGVLAGLGARWAGKGRSFAAGALAAILTILCFVGGKFGASYILQNSAKQAQIDPAAVAESTEEVEEIATPSGPADALALEEQFSGGNNPSFQSLDYDSQQPQSTMDTVWIVVGTILAYFLGRGSGDVASTAAQPPTEAEPSSGGDAPNPAAGADADDGE
ncbi:MAG: hypothetical protein AAGF97_00380 [Planctomycetota bacterium]